MNTRNTNAIIPPTSFPDREQITLIANTVLMGFGSLTLLMAFLVGIKLVYEFLFSSDKAPFNLISLFAQIVSVLLLFSLAWGSGLISIKVLNNRIYPLILWVACIFVSLGMVIIYLWGVYKCYNEMDLGVAKYAAVLFAGYLVLVAFALLSERIALLVMAVPLGAAVLLHIFLLVFHYVVYGAQTWEFVFKDLSLMAIVAILLGLMAALGLPAQQPKPAKTQAD